MIGRFRLALKRRKYQNFHKNHRNQHLDSYIFIDSVLERFHSGGGLVNDYQGYKLFSLVCLLNSIRPQRILELGTGSSSVILADYCRRNGASLTCVDENENWLHHTRNLVSELSPSEKIEFMHAERRHRFEGSHLFLFYDSRLSERAFDLIIVDGPSMRVNGERRKDAVCVDALSLAEGLDECVILVDVREATVRYMMDCLDRTRYEIQESDLFSDKLKNGEYVYFSRIDKLAKGCEQPIVKDPN